MPVTTAHVVSWCAGSATLATAALAGAGFATQNPFAWMALFGALGASALTVRAICCLRHPRVLLRTPPATSGDSLTVTADRLRLLESAVIHAHDAVVVLDAQARGGQGRCVLYVNDAFCRMTGYDRIELIGRSLHMLRGPESDPATLDAIRQTLTNGQPLRAELRNYRKDGTAFWVDLSLVPVPDKEGRITHWVMIQRDITQRRATEDALRRSEAMFRGIFENASAGVSLTDSTGRFISCNPAFAGMTGRSVEQLLALSPIEITHPEDWAEQELLMAEVRAGTRDRFHISKRYVRPDGEMVWVELSFATIRGPASEFEYGLGISLNVTERRRLEEQLRQAQKMEALGQMAGGVAHDFNNLLTVVLGNLGRVELTADDPNRELLTAVEYAAARAADLTGKLLGYARRNQLMFAPVHPRDSFEELVGLLRHTLDPRVRLVIRVADECGPIQADPTLLSQALMNLCLNARDAMPGGGTLTLSAEVVDISDPPGEGQPCEARAGRFVRVSVTDTGVGMTPEVKARLFEPFFTTKGPGKGTGLGLAMVQGIVQQHRGWVTYESAPGEGTRIDLYLPPAEPTAISTRAVHRSPFADPVVSHTPLALPRLPDRLPLTPPPVDVVELPGARSTILLVDDEAMIRDLAKAVLERAGYRILTANDGIEAVDLFRREHASIDLVILDVTMPRMSGRDAFRHMIEIDPTACILFSTGYATDDVGELDGARGLLGKPYRPHELLMAVRAALEPQPVNR